MKYSMQENQLFEYAVIRVVPRVEREEFLNVGVILYAKKPQFLKVVYFLSEERVLSLAPDLDIEEVRCHLTAFEQIAHADTGGGPIAQLDHASRFRWLTARRSTIVQTSAVHPGLSTDMEKTLEKLFGEMV